MLVYVLTLAGVLWGYHYFHVPDYAGHQVRSLPGKNVLNGDRLTDEFIRVLGFARFVLAERGGSVIGVEQVFLATLRTNAEMIRRLVAADWTIERLTASVEALMPLGPPIPDETEARFSTSANQVVRSAIAEADSLGSVPVTPSHLLLALLSDESTRIGSLLRDAGVTREAVVTDIQRGPDGR